MPETKVTKHKHHSKEEEERVIEEKKKTREGGRRGRYHHNKRGRESGVPGESRDRTTSKEKEEEGKEAKSR